MKDVLTLNEIEWISEIGQSLNEWAVGYEDSVVDDEGKTLRVRAVMVTVEDSDGKPFGTFTKYTSSHRENLKFEPDFVPDIVGE